MFCICNIGGATGRSATSAHEARFAEVTDALPKKGLKIIDSELAFN